jgi:hypothetical protein
MSHWTWSRVVTRSLKEPCPSVARTSPHNYVRVHVTKQIRTTLWSGPAVISLTNVGRGERIRTSDLSVPNQSFGKNVSSCLFKSCSHHRFSRVFTFRPIRYDPVHVVCWTFWSQISHTRKPVFNHTNDACPIEKFPDAFSPVSTNIGMVSLF